MLIRIIGITVAASLASSQGCSKPVSTAAAPVALRLTTGPEGGGFYPLGEQIAQGINARVPGMQLRSVFSPGAVANVEAIQKGEADLALTFADVAYLGFSGQLDANSEPLPRLRGVAVLHLTPVALAIRPGLSIVSPADLRGRTVAVGPPGSGTALTARLILEAFGLDASSVRVEFLGFNDAARRLLQGRIDAMFDNAISQAASVKDATEGGARLLPIDGPAVARLRSTYPFLRPTMIRRSLYPAIREGVRTIGVDGLLICRSDLADAAVYQITKELFNVLPEMSLGGGSRVINLDLAPATPIPLHAGAARYYRERELLR